MADGKQPDQTIRRMSEERFQYELKAAEQRGYERGRQEQLEHDYKLRAEAMETVIQPMHLICPLCEKKVCQHTTKDEIEHEEALLAMKEKEAEQRGIEKGLEKAKGYNQVNYAQGVKDGIEKGINRVENELAKRHLVRGWSGESLVQAAIKAARKVK